MATTLTRSVRLTRVFVVEHLLDDGTWAERHGSFRVFQRTADDTNALAYATRQLRCYRDGSAFGTRVRYLGRFADPLADLPVESRDTFTLTYSPGQPG